MAKEDITAHHPGIRATENPKQFFDRSEIPILLREVPGKPRYDIACGVSIFKATCREGSYKSNDLLIRKFWSHHKKLVLIGKTYPRVEIVLPVAAHTMKNHNQTQGITDDGRPIVPDPIYPRQFIPIRFERVFAAGGFDWFCRSWLFCIATD